MQPARGGAFARPNQYQIIITLDPAIHAAEEADGVSDIEIHDTFTRSAENAHSNARNDSRRGK